MDYADENQREIQGKHPRFSLHRLDADGCVTDADPVIETDDFMLVLTAIEDRRKLLVED